MWVYAEIIDGVGAVVARKVGDVSQDDDLTALVQMALDRFHQLHPDGSVVTEVGIAGLTVRFGMAEEVN